MPDSPAASQQRLPQPARREQLLDVAEELFLTKGFANVTMEDVARAAGISRPIPYNHFGSKEGLYVACVERARRTYADELSRRLRLIGNPIDQLRAGMDYSFSVLEQAPGRWRLLFTATALPPGEHSQELERLRFETIGLVAELFRAAADSTVPDEILTAFAHASSGAAERLGHWWLANPTVTRGTLVDYYIAFVLDGLRPHMRT